MRRRTPDAGKRDAGRGTPDTAPLFPLPTTQATEQGGGKTKGSAAARSEALPPVCHPPPPEGPAPLRPARPTSRVPWPTAKLGEVAELDLGKMLDQKKNKGIPRKYLANVDVRWGAFNLGNLKEMRFLDSELERYGLKFGDIVMCEGGEPGRCAIWKDQIPGMMYQKALHRIRPHKELDFRFLYYWFLILGYKNGFDRLFTGSTIKHMPKDKLALLEIPLPPLPVQHRIADILSAYDDLIENNRRRIAILEETARLAYRKWFGDTTARTAPLGEIADVVMGQSPESKTYNAEGEGLPFHQGVTGFGFRYPSNEMWCTAGTRFAEEGDILFSVRAPVGRINVSSEKIVIGRGLSAMRAKNGCQSWLLYTLKQYFSKEDMIGVGCIFASTTKKELLSVRLPFPPKDEILDFEQYISPMDSQIKALTRQYSNLAATRDMLLPRLMKGGVG